MDNWQGTILLKGLTLNDISTDNNYGHEVTQTTSAANEAVSTGYATASDSLLNDVSVSYFNYHFPKEQSDKKACSGNAPTSDSSSNDASASYDYGYNVTKKTPGDKPIPVGYCPFTQEVGATSIECETPSVEHTLLSTYPKPQGASPTSWYEAVSDEEVSNAMSCLENLTSNLFSTVEQRNLCPGNVRYLLNDLENTTQKTLMPTEYAPFTEAVGATSIEYQASSVERALLSTYTKPQETSTSSYKAVSGEKATNATSCLENVTNNLFSTVVQRNLCPGTIPYLLKDLENTTQKTPMPTEYTPFTEKLGATSIEYQASSVKRALLSTYTKPQETCPTSCYEAVSDENATNATSCLENVTSNLFPTADERNLCPAIIHYLIKDLENTGYVCKLCYKPTSVYYSDSMDLVRNTNIFCPLLEEAASPKSARLESNSVPPVFPNNSSNNMKYMRKRAICNFCKQNGESPLIFRSHWLKSLDGKVSCPVLRKYKCKICDATGDYAHTRKYCPRYIAELNVHLSHYKMQNDK